MLSWIFVDFLPLGGAWRDEALFGYFFNILGDVPREVSCSFLIISLEVDEGR